MCHYFYITFDSDTTIFHVFVHMVHSVKGTHDFAVPAARLEKI